jgi:hypothetical protein
LSYIVCLVCSLNINTVSITEITETSNDDGLEGMWMEAVMALTPQQGVSSTADKECEI